MKRAIKSGSSKFLAILLRPMRSLAEGWRRLRSHASLASDLAYPLPDSVVVLGLIQVFGNGRVRIGNDVLLYPDIHLETHGDALIEINDGAVISRGVHIVAMAGISIGPGTMIGEYSSIRDANHTRDADSTLRDSRHDARPIQIGSEVWIGRGVAVLAGVNIGDEATIGANAVVTRDVEAGATAVGVPAKPLSTPIGTRSQRFHSPQGALDN